MKKVFILSYFFPPCNLVGARRPYSWYKHFHKFGIYPVVITRHWNHPVKTINDSSIPDISALKIEKHDWGEVHYLPYKGSFRDRFLLNHGESWRLIRRLLTLFELVFQFVHFRFNPYRIFYLYIEQLIKNTSQPDAVIISANPYPQFAVGYYLFKKYNIRWIADYRDDWTTNTRLNKSGMVQKFIHKLEKKAEKKWVSSAYFFITVTREYIQKIEQLLNKKEGFLVLNGFEETEIKPIKKTKEKNILNLLYAGTVYERQQFLILADGINQFVSENKELKINIVFAGAKVDGRIPNSVLNFQEQVKEFVNEFTVTERLDSETFNAHVEKADVLFTVPYGNLKGEMPAKLFQYLSWGKPILLGGNDRGTINDFLKPYSLSWIAEDKADVLSALTQINNALVQDNLTLREEDFKYIAQYSRENQAQKLAEILHQKI